MLAVSASKCRFDEFTADDWDEEKNELNRFDGSGDIDGDEDRDDDENDEHEDEEDGDKAVSTDPPLLLALLYIMCVSVCFALL